MLRATCAIPIYFPPVQMDGETYYDGGLADPIPILRSLHDGNERNLIVLTQPESYRKNAWTRRAVHRKVAETQISGNAQGAA